MGLASLPEEEKTHRWRQRLRAVAPSQGKPGDHSHDQKLAEAAQDPPAGVGCGDGLPAMTSDCPVELQEGASVGLSCPAAVFCYSSHGKLMHPLEWSQWVRSAQSWVSAVQMKGAPF